MYFSLVNRDEDDYEYKIFSVLSRVEYFSRMREKTLRLLPTLFKSLNADSLASDMDLYCSACCLACCNWSSSAKI